MALETENGGNSGIDTIMRTLAEKRLIEDRAPTLDGSWMQRIMDARSANGNFLHSTMTPFSSSCGMSGVHGNLCSWGVARMGWRGRSDSSLFDKKLYLAVYYLGSRICKPILLLPDGILERLKHKVTRDDLYYTWLANWSNGQTAPQTAPPQTMQHWNKPKLWDYLVARETAARHGGRRGSRTSRRRYAGTRSFSRCRQRRSGIDGRSGYGRPGLVRP